METKRDWLIFAGIVVSSIIVGLVVEALQFKTLTDALAASWSGGDYGGAFSAFTDQIGEFGTLQWVEFVGFLTGIVSVYFATRENVWVWPVGIVWTLTTMWVMFQIKLYGEVGLMGVYFVLMVHGWWSWKRVGEEHKELQVRWTSRAVLIAVVAFVVVGTIVAKPILETFRDSAPLADAFTTAGSLGAQFLLNRKYIENWIAWLIVDIIYVPLMISRGIYAFAVLYAVFLVLAVIGLVQWIKSYRQEASSV